MAQAYEGEAELAQAYEGDAESVYTEKAGKSTVCEIEHKKASRQ